MTHRVAWIRTVAAVALVGLVTSVQAGGGDCGNNDVPKISFVEFSAPNLQNQAQPFTVKGKLSLPSQRDGRSGCIAANGRRLPAVVILHGSAGVDARGDFYEAALNQAGIATLQIDMWEARGVATAADRPKAPILTYGDAFAALAFLAAQPSIDSQRIGVLGFSWGGVMSLAASEQAYVGMFGGGRKFKAHVAHYPVCYAFNNALPGLPPPLQLGTQLLNPTGAKVLVQIGALDDYDNGGAPCRALAQSLNPTGRNTYDVVEYAGALHAFDRLMVPIVVHDPFGNQGSYFQTGQLPPVRIGPDVDQAFAARDKAVRFLARNL